MILSAQSIRWLCSDQNHPLITPFVERGVIRGRSYGLSACTYDCRIAHPLVLPVGQFRLAVTLEQFVFPDNVCASVLDKSSWARKGVTCFNTHFDPGFKGFATIELANLGTECVEYQEGDPVCQFKFEYLDEPTELPYHGKYQNQPMEPVKARKEYEVL